MKYRVRGFIAGLLAVLFLSNCVDSKSPTEPMPDFIVADLVATHDFEWIFNGVGNSFQMRTGQSYEVRITNTDMHDAHGFSGIPALGMNGVYLPPGGVVTLMVMPTAVQVGMHPFSCSVECGEGHSRMLATIQVVQEL